MTKLTDMAFTAAEKKERNKKSTEPCGIGGYPDYPYGLNVHLEDDHLKKLGIDKLPDVGDELTLTAKCIVTSVSSNKSEGGRNNRRVELQMRKMALDDEPQSMEDAVDAGISKAK